MGSGAAVADPPADLEQKRREAAGEGEPDAGEAEAAPSGGGQSGEAVQEHEGEKPEAKGDGDFPGEDEGEQGPPPLAVEGEGQLSLTVGGQKPDKASVKLRGGSIEIPAGQLKKGDVVNLLVKVQVAEVHFVDKIDNSTGDITGVERRHVAKIKGVEKVSV